MIFANFLAHSIVFWESASVRLLVVFELFFTLQNILDAYLFKVFKALQLSVKKLNLGYFDLLDHAIFQLLHQFFHVGFLLKYELVALIDLVVFLFLSIGID